MKLARSRWWIAAGGAVVATVAAPIELGSQIRTAAPAGVVLRSGRKPLRDGRGSWWYAALVDLCTGRYAFRATGPGESPSTVPTWASRRGAVVAVNGDYFRAGVPTGPARGDGRWWVPVGSEHHDALLALGPGTLLRCVAAREGTFPETFPDAAERAGGAAEVIAARERIVVRGAATLNPLVNGARERHPRTSFGWSADGRTLVVAVVDGRSADSAGMTTPELSALMIELGASEAVKMDGGGSSTLWVAGLGVLNRPSDGAPRSVASHLGLVAARGEASTPQACHSR